MNVKSVLLVELSIVEKNIHKNPQIVNIQIGNCSCIVSPFEE